ncbi:hypothetical protein [Jannaschia formosa]|uniref:hypothetical protein n=1 Tax=Jannaschia formosa TaxID=2259592 RepID=UPI000E1C3A9C|nr:hypothetical protein [Jannaschia formosa]TFL16028.1 hypothetical protein DR046_22135 [Jannaschia formosa]
MIRAQTMAELKKKLRRDLGWPDGRSWTDGERTELAACYTLRADHRRGDFVAEPKTDGTDR